MAALTAPLLLWWMACGLRRVPHYEPVSWTLEPLDLPAWQLEDAVRRDLQRGRLSGLVIDGSPVAPDELASVDPQVLGVLYSLTQRWARHAELDLWVPYPDTEPPQRRAMTLFFDRRLGARVVLGELEPVPSPRPAMASPAAREAIGRGWLGGFVDGDARWTTDDLAVAAAAVEALEPEVQPLLHGLQLRRMRGSPRAAHRELAWFDPTTEPPVIEVYDLCFAETSGFVGPVDAPMPSAAMTLVHELGHAVADRPLREAWVALEELRAEPDPDPREVAEARAAWVRLGGRGPVIEAWAEVRDGPGPAPYGARSVHESFAEAYALHRLDPDALRRAMPAAAEWFDAGGHLAAADPSR